MVVYPTNNALQVAYFLFRADLIGPFFDFSGTIISASCISALAELKNSDGETLPVN